MRNWMHCLCYSRFINAVLPYTELTKKFCALRTAFFQVNSVLGGPIVHNGSTLQHLNIKILTETRGHLM